VGSLGRKDESSKSKRKWTILFFVFVCHYYFLSFSFPFNFVYTVFESFLSCSWKIRRSPSLAAGLDFMPETPCLFYILAYCMKLKRSCYMCGASGVYILLLRVVDERKSFSVNICTLKLNGNCGWKSKKKIIFSPKCCCTSLAFTMKWLNIKNGWSSLWNKLNVKIKYKNWLAVDSRLSKHFI